MVGGSDHYTHLIGQLGALRVVVIERLAPHRGPHEVALEPQDQIEDMLVEPVIEPAERVFRPTRERGVLVVEEDAAVAHHGLVAETARRRIDDRTLADRDIGPPGPWGDSKTPGYLVGAENRPSLVGARDDERPLHARKRSIDHLKDVRFPLPLDAADLQPMLLGQSMDHRAVSERSDDDEGTPGRRSGHLQSRACPGDPGQVIAQPTGSAQDSWEVI